METQNTIQKKEDLHMQDLLTIRDRVQNLRNICAYGDYDFAKTRTELTHIADHIWDMVQNHKKLVEA